MFEPRVRPDGRAFPGRAKVVSIRLRPCPGFPRPRNRARPLAHLLSFKHLVLPPVLLAPGNSCFFGFEIHDGVELMGESVAGTGPPHQRIFPLLLFPGVDLPPADQRFALLARGSGGGVNSHLRLFVFEWEG